MNNQINNKTRLDKILHKLSISKNDLIPLSLEESGYVANQVKNKETGIMPEIFENNLNKKIKDNTRWIVLFETNSDLPMIVDDTAFIFSNEIDADQKGYELAEHYKLYSQLQRAYDENVFHLLLRMGVKTVSINYGDNNCCRNIDFFVGEKYRREIAINKGDPGLMNPVFHRAVNKYFNTLTYNHSSEAVYNAQLAFIDVCNENYFIVERLTLPDNARPTNLQLACVNGSQLNVYSDFFEYKKVNPKEGASVLFLTAEQVFRLSKVADILLDAGSIALSLGKDFWDIFSKVNSKTQSAKSILQAKAAQITDDPQKIDSIISDIMEYDDICEECIATMFQENNPEWDGVVTGNITVCGYTASILLKTMFDNSLEAYRFLAGLRKDPEKSKLALKTGII